MPAESRVWFTVTAEFKKIHPSHKQPVNMLSVTWGEKYVFCFRAFIMNQADQGKEMEGGFGLLHSLQLNKQEIMFKVPAFCEEACEELVPQACMNFSCSNLEGGEENKSNACALKWWVSAGRRRRTQSDVMLFTKASFVSSFLNSHF